MTEPTTVCIDGVTLRRRRIAAGYSLEAFSQRAGISRPYLSLIEIGTRRQVSLEVFDRFCRLLAVNDRYALVRSVGRRQAFKEAGRTDATPPSAEPAA